MTTRLAARESLTVRQTSVLLEHRAQDVACLLDALRVVQVHDARELETEGELGSADYCNLHSLFPLIAPCVPR